MILLHVCLCAHVACWLYHFFHLLWPLLPWGGAYGTKASSVAPEKKQMMLDNNFVTLKCVKQEWKQKWKPLKQAKMKTKRKAIEASISFTHPCFIHYYQQNMTTVAFKAALGWIGFSPATQEAIVDQFIEDVMSLTMFQRVILSEHVKLSRMPQPTWILLRLLSCRSRTLKHSTSGQKAERA